MKFSLFVMLNSMHLSIVYQITLVVAKVIVNISLYIKLNLITSVISMLKNENNTFLREYIREWLSGYGKK